MAPGEFPIEGAEIERVDVRIAGVAGTDVPEFQVAPDPADVISAAERPSVSTDTGIVRGADPRKIRILIALHAAMGGEVIAKVLDLLSRSKTA